MGRLLIECTYVFEHPEENSGIQRVVRNIIRELPNVSTDIECIPVILNGGKVHQVLRLAPTRVPVGRAQIKWLIAQLSELRHRFWQGHARLDRRIHAAHTLRRMLFVACKAISLGIALPIRGLTVLDRNIPDPDRTRPFEVVAGDQLVLLDSSWHSDVFRLIDNVRAKGVSIVAVVYDLIPLTHPQFCDAGLVQVFDKWFDWVAETADGFMAISATIRDQLMQEIQRRFGAAYAETRWYDHFKLGSDLDLAQVDSAVNRRVASIFADGMPVYLMVSTIEPRKNHAYLLDAFETLWARGLDVRLCIIGKIGWKTEALVERIRLHREFGKRLFMCNGVDDSSLEFAYRSSRALLFPSFVEGFGLPLVEAMQRQLPAMASDIPVFREVGGDFLAYFNLHDPASLADKVAEYERTSHFPAPLSVGEWQWPGWREATQEFVDKVLAGVASMAAEPIRDEGMSSIKVGAG